jgi:hypothetical protein
MTQQNINEIGDASSPPVVPVETPLLLTQERGSLNGDRGARLDLAVVSNDAALMGSSRVPQPDTTSESTWVEYTALDDGSQPTPHAAAQMLYNRGVSAMERAHEQYQLKSCVAKFEIEKRVASAKRELNGVCKDPFVGKFIDTASNALQQSKNCLKTAYWSVYDKADWFGRGPSASHENEQGLCYGRILKAWCGGFSIGKFPKLKHLFTDDIFWELFESNQLYEWFPIVINGPTLHVPAGRDHPDLVWLNSGYLFQAYRTGDFSYLPDIDVDWETVVIGGTFMNEMAHLNGNPNANDLYQWLVPKIDSMTSVMIYFNCFLVLIGVARIFLACCRHYNGGSLSVWIIVKTFIRMVLAMIRIVLVLTLSLMWRVLWRVHIANVRVVSYHYGQIVTICVPYGRKTRNWCLETSGQVLLLVSQFKSVMFNVTTKSLSLVIRCWQCVLSFLVFCNIVLGTLIVSLTFRLTSIKYYSLGYIELLTSRISILCYRIHNFAIADLVRLFDHIAYQSILFIWKHCLTSSLRRRLYVDAVGGSYALIVSSTSSVLLNKLRDETGYCFLRLVKEWTPLEERLAELGPFPSMEAVNEVLSSALRKDYWKYRCMLNDIVLFQVEDGVLHICDNNSILPHLKVNTLWMGKLWDRYLPTPARLPMDIERYKTLRARSIQSIPGYNDVQRAKASAYNLGRLCRLTSYELRLKTAYGYHDVRNAISRTCNWGRIFSSDVITTAADFGAVVSDSVAIIGDTVTLHPISAVERSIDLIKDVTTVADDVEKVRDDIAPHDHDPMEENWFTRFLTGLKLPPPTSPILWGGSSHSVLNNLGFGHRRGWGYQHLFIKGSPTQEAVLALGAFPTVEDFFKIQFDLEHDMSGEPLFIQLYKGTLVMSLDHDYLMKNVEWSYVTPSVVLYTLERVYRYRRRWVLEPFTIEPEHDLVSTTEQIFTLEIDKETSTYAPLPGSSWKYFIRDIVEPEYLKNNANLITRIGGPSMSIIPDENRNGYCYAKLVYPDTTTHREIFILGSNPTLGRVLNWLRKNGQRHDFSKRVTVEYDPITGLIHIERGGSMSTQILLNMFMTWQNSKPVSLTFLFKTAPPPTGWGLSDTENVTRSQERWLECKVGFRHHRADNENFHLLEWFFTNHPPDNHPDSSSTTGNQLGVFYTNHPPHTTRQNIELSCAETGCGKLEGSDTHHLDDRGVLPNNVKRE